MGPTLTPNPLRESEQRSAGKLSGIHCNVIDRFVSHRVHGLGSGLRGYGLRSEEVAESSLCANSVYLGPRAPWTCLTYLGELAVAILHRHMRCLSPRLHHTGQISVHGVRVWGLWFDDHVEIGFGAVSSLRYVI